MKTKYCKGCRTSTFVKTSRASPFYDLNYTVFIV